MNPLLRSDHCYDLPTFRSDYKLLPVQNEGVEFLLSKWNALLSFQTGLGKTLCSVTAAQHCLNYSKDVLCIIFCPKKAIKAFKTELTENLKQEYSVFSADEEIKNSNARYLIFAYSSVHKYEALIQKLAEVYKLLAIVDELHGLANVTSRVTQVMTRLRPFFKSCFGLTATPLLNDMAGLYNVVNFVRPGYLGTAMDFTYRYLVQKKRKIRVRSKGGKFVERVIYETVGFKNLDSLKESLDRICLTRRISYNITFYYHQTEPTEVELGYYKTAAQGLIAEGYDEDNPKVAAARLHDLQRVTDGSYDSMPNVIYQKERLLAKVVKSITDRGESALIYCEYQSTVNKLSTLLKNNQAKLGIHNFHFITGETPFKKRLEVEHAISPRDVVIVTEAGKESINLQLANNVIFYDIPFSIGDFIQMVGRITRVSTEYSIQRIHLIEVKGTIDTYKRMLIQEHASLIKALFGENEQLPSDIATIDRRFINKIRHALLWKS